MCVSWHWTEILPAVFNPRFVPPLQPFAPFELIRYNVERDEPVRDKRGLCIRVPPGKGCAKTSPETPGRSPGRELSILQSSPKVRRGCWW